MLRLMGFYCRILGCFIDLGCLDSVFEYVVASENTGDERNSWVQSIFGRDYFDESADVSADD